MIQVNHPEDRLAGRIFLHEDIGGFEIGLVDTLLVQKRHVRGKLSNKGPFPANLPVRHRRRKVLLNIFRESPVLGYILHDEKGFFYEEKLSSFYYCEGLGRFHPQIQQKLCRLKGLHRTGGP